MPLLSAPLPIAAVYLLAALAEIAGCFAFWAWLRLGRSAWWALPGVAALIVFALLLTRVDAPFGDVPLFVENRSSSVPSF